MKENRIYKPLEKTNICLEFSIYTYKNTFNPNEITKLLGIIPSETYIQKNKIIEDNLVVKETCWELNIDYEESEDINNQINKIMNLLFPKKEILKEIVQKYSANIQFMVVIKINNNEWPNMYLKKDFIKFVADIGGEIQFDPYYY